MTRKRLLAGVSLAALGAAGLTMLSAPAFASGVVGWYLVGAGGGNSSPSYKCEGTYAPTSSPSCSSSSSNPIGTGGINTAVGPAPEYAEQAIDSAGSTALTIPGYGSGSPYGGFTWYDPSLAGSAGGNAFLIFTVPTGETIKSIGGTSCSPSGSIPSTSLGGVDGTVFTNIVGLSCTPTQIQAVVTVAPGKAGQTAWYQLPAFQLNTTGPGGVALVAALGAPTANGGSAATEGGNCETPTLANFAACEITATTSQLSSVTGGGSAVMATSENVVSLRTFNNSSLICIDVLEDQQPGTRFQQPCQGNVLSSNLGNAPITNLYVWGSATKVDGDVNGAPETGSLSDPYCKTTDINVAYVSGSGASAECGNGSVTGSVTNLYDKLVADKGTIEINVTELLSLDGIHIYQWKGNSVQNPTITIVGLCAGLEGPIENIGSTACAGGLKPFTGETANGGYVGLTPLTASGTGPIVLNGLNGFTASSSTPAGASAFCPKEDDIPATSISLTVPGNGSTATFASGQLSLQDIPNNTMLPNTGYISLPSYYEFCDYADGQTILGPVAQWFVTVTVDAGQTDVTVLTDNPTGLSSIGTQSATIGTQQIKQPANALLVYEFNGVGQLFQFTNGGGNYSAYLRVVNLMEDYQVSTPATCTNLDPNLTCEPAGAVVCKVWGDDGQNAFVTVWNSAGTADGQLTGTNAMIAVSSLFAQAGISASNANPFDLGAMLCFHNERIHLSQFWIEPNGGIVNIQ